MLRSSPRYTPSVTLELRNISKSYDGGRAFAVEDVSFAAAPGELVVMVGESGCGKTTTLKTINRLVNGRTSVSAEMAIKLGAAFRTSPEFWLNAQKAVDLYHAAASATDLPSPVLKAS